MKKITILVGTFILLGVILMSVSTQATGTSTTSTSTVSVQELIQTMQQQIAELKAQIEALTVQLVSLRKAKGEVKETVKEIKTTLKMTRRLWREMSGEDVELLQEILATDPDVYPEALITGYFGPLTERAVKKFQKISGIEQVGVVGPKTLARINELLEEGAGQSGKVPPGLLIAQGIRKKLDFEPKPLPGQELPPGIAKKLQEATTTPPEEPDVKAPFISEVVATSTTATTTVITWFTDEEADSKVWYDTATPLVVTDLTPMATSSVLVTEHEITVFDLTPDTTYYYLVSSADETGNYEISIEGTFDTSFE